VTVSTERVSEGASEHDPYGRLCLHVKDTGRGIDPAFMPHLFEVFKQESTGMSRSHEGSGLGLSITKQLVDLMGGEITVESQVGVGTSFRVFFPIVAPSPSRTVREPTEITVFEGTQARLLVVEDNKDTQVLIQSLLEKFGSVKVASNAEEAMREAAHSIESPDGRFDMVLMDINLGDGPSGTEVMKSLRAIPAYREVPVAALTAYALPGEQEAFLKAGFNAYLSKPFKEEDLLKLISQLLKA